MADTQKSIEVNVPVRVAYNQWTQFEDFPHFMEGVQEVKQLDDKRQHWRAEIAGKEQEWDAEITEQVPDKVMAWHSTTGAPNGGNVSFESLGPDQARVTLSLTYEPQGIVETAGAALGVVDRQIQGDRNRFISFIESQGRETGAWRGVIQSGEIKSNG